MAGADGRPIGILAGGGSLPFEIAADLQQRGIAVHIVGIDGFVGSGVASFPHTIIGLGQLGGMLAALRDTGCREMVIVGALERPDLRRLRFDLGALRHLPAVLSLTRGGDDSLLRRIVRFFEGQGLIVRGIGEVAPGLLAPAGRIAGPTPCPRLEAAIGRARAALADLSRFDIGQAAVARPDGLVAVEAAEGTRRMLARLAAAGGAGADAVLVKLPKLDQEMRIDLPAIGPDTVTRAAEAGLKGIAVLAGRTIAAQRAELVRRANSLRLFVEGIAEPTVAAPQRQNPAIPNQIALTFVTGSRLSPDTQASAIKGVRVVSALTGYGIGQAAVVVRRHVLAVEAAEGSLALLDRVATLRQWGESRHKRRGVAVLRAGAETGVRAIEAAARAGLEGVVIVATGPQSLSPVCEATGAAARLGLFLATVLVEELEATDD